MAKGPLITQETRMIIAKVYLEHPDYRAKEVQYEVNRLLSGKGPGLSAIQKELAKIRKMDEYRSPESKELDRPWSLGTLCIKHEYELPPEVIPIVLDVQRTRPKPDAYAERTAEMRRELEDIDTPHAREILRELDKPFIPFSIREAKWVARISYVLKDRVTPEFIGHWAHTYATYEKECELAGVECDTSKLDIGLRVGDYYGYLLWVGLKYSDMSFSQESAHESERSILGHTLEDIELTRLGWALYALWLIFINERTAGWPNLLTKEREDVVKRLRSWVLEQEPVKELKRPEELLKEVTKLAKEVKQNEGIHQTKE